MRRPAISTAAASRVLTPWLPFLRSWRIPYTLYVDPRTFHAVAAMIEQLPGSMQPLRAMRGAASAFPAIIVILAAIGCSDTSGPPASEFRVIPDTASALVGQSRQFTAIDAPGTVVWTSSDENVASIIPQTGSVSALARGTSQITAMSGAAEASAMLTVLAPPALAVSAPIIEFEQLAGGAAPAAQTVTLTNAGDGAIDNVTVGPITYGAGEQGGWLTATANGSTTPVSITLQATGTGLRGTYTAIVPYHADGVANSPQHTAVTFRVRAPAAIAVSRSTVPMSGIPGAALNETVGVTNAGDLPLTGLTATVTYAAGQPQGWLTATLGSTTAPATLTLAANTAGLAAGSYSATVQLASSVAGVAPVNITVPLTISAGPAIQLSASTVDVNATYAANPAARTVTVQNSGGGTLSGLSLGAVTYGAGQSTGWLARSINTTTAPATITLTFTTAPLASGNYTASIPVQSGTASNSPVHLTVNVTVGPPPTISVNPSSVAFATWGGAALPGSQAVQITNTGGGTLSGLSASVGSYTGTSPGWLTATFSGGTTAPATLTLRPNTTALTAGTRTAVVTVSSAVPGVASRTVTVTYTTQTFTTTVFPTFKTAGCTGCHGATAPVINAGTTATQYYNTLVPAHVTAGNPAGSELVCKIFGACAHGGGKFTGIAGFQAAVTAWIAAGAPFQ